MKGLPPAVSQPARAEGSAPGGSEGPVEPWDGSIIKLLVLARPFAAILNAAISAASCQMRSDPP